MKKLTGIVLTTCILALSFALTSTSFAQSDTDSLDDLLEKILNGDEETPTDAPAEKEHTDKEEHEAAEDILNQLDDKQWEYAKNKKTADIKVINTTESSATIETTKALYNNKDVKSYRVYYSKESLATQKYSDIKDEIITASKTTNEMVELELKKLDKNTTYYIVVSPINPNDENDEPLTMITSEIKFSTKGAGAPKEEDKKDTETKNTTDKTTKILENVAYKAENGKITLSRKSSSSDKVSIKLRHQSDAGYTDLGEVKANTGSFTFNVDKTGNFFLKMKPVNNEGTQSGKEHIQTVKVSTISEENTPTVGTAPQVGPTTNLLIALFIFAFIVFMTYRFRRIEK